MDQREVISEINSDKDHLVFRYNEHSNIATLDPAFASNPQLIWPTNQLFNSLVRLDDELNPWIIEVNHSPSFATDS